MLLILTFGTAKEMEDLKVMLIVIRLNVVVQSLVEAEYIIVATVSHQAIWIRKVLTDFNHV